MTLKLEDLRGTLEAAGQSWLADHLDTLSPRERENLLTQVREIDWPEVGRLIESHVKRKPTFTAPHRLEPAPCYPASPTPDLVERYEQAKRLGCDLLRQGKVAAFTVAGGQGTRLGWDAPKGTFPATPIRGLPLFGVFAEYLRKVGEKFGRTPPWYVMTSPVNHEDTLAFFAQHDYFGFARDQVMIFPQAMMPAIDMLTHRVLLAGPDELALSPNGHGGSLKALYTSGALDSMRRRGVEHISYIQIDNPLVKVVDPLFIGLHALDDAQMSSKMIPKRDAAEKVGVFALADGKMTVIEYTNLPDELARQVDPVTGQLRYLAGSIAIHVIAVDFVERLNTQATGFSLPWNRAEKKVPYLNAAGQVVKPEKPNAIKLETFVFDALPLGERSIVLETRREDEFAPIKNADTPDGQAQDSPASSKWLQVERAIRWLRAAGVSVEDGAVVEIKGTTAIEPQDLLMHQLPSHIPAHEPRLL